MNEHRKSPAGLAQLFFAIALGSLAFLPLACGGPITQPSLPKPTKTFTRTATSTFTVVFTATNTRTVSFTPTLIATSTDTPVATNTSTLTPISTLSNTPTKTYTATETRTFTNSPTITDTPTATNTRTITNTPTSVATAMATAPDFNLSSGVTTLNTGIYYFNCVNIGAGGTVTINGGVTIFAKCFNLDSGATITGIGKSDALYGGSGRGSGGWATFSNAGIIGSDDQFGGGGGHGGAGGESASNFGVTSGCYDFGNAITYCYSPAVGGGVNDDPLLPNQTGSGGWNSCNSYCVGNCSAGGALLKVVVLDPLGGALQSLTVNGTIDMSGYFGCSYDPYPDNKNYGGGAGGTILLEASVISGNGKISANGGDGSSGIGGSGGGGGGGIISLIADTTSFFGNTSVVAGSNGIGAQPGIVTITAPPPNGFW